MGRFDYEKKASSWGRSGGNKGDRASPKTQFRGRCNICGGTLPCRNSDCRKSLGAERHKAHKTAPTKKAKRKIAKTRQGCVVLLFVGGGAFGGIIYGLVELLSRLTG